MKTNGLKVVDIFSGAGGFSEGFRQAGYLIIDNAEFDKFALKTYVNNFEETLQNNHLPVDLSNEADLNKFINSNKEKKIDVLIGGFPCQGYSLIGKRDPNDERNQLYKPTLKIIKELNPKIFVLENVPGILSMNNGEDVNNIVNFLRKNDWNVEYEILDSSNFNVPQFRKRIFFIGTKDKTINVKKIFSNLSKIRNEKISAGYVLEKISKTEKLINHEKTNHKLETIEKMKKLNEGDPLYPNFAGGTKKIFWNRPSPTIRDNHGGTFIHPKENRYLTAREIAEIQTFPTNFEFCGPKTRQLKQIGNAVPPKLAKSIAKEIEKWLK